MIEEMEVEPSKKENNLKRKNPFETEKMVGEPPIKRILCTYKKQTEFIKNIKEAENLPKKEAKILVINTVFSLLEFSPSRTITKEIIDDNLDKSSYQVDNSFDSDEESDDDRIERYKMYQEKLNPYIKNFDVGLKVNKILNKVDKMLKNNKQPFVLLPKKVLEQEVYRKNLKNKYIHIKNYKNNLCKISRRDLLIEDRSYSNYSLAKELLDKKNNKVIRKIEKNKTLLKYRADLVDKMQ